MPIYRPKFAINNQMPHEAGNCVWDQWVRDGYTVKGLSEDMPNNSVFIEYKLGRMPTCAANSASCEILNNLHAEDILFF